MNSSVVWKRPINPMKNQTREEIRTYEFPASVRLLTQTGLANQFIVQLNKRLESAPATQLYRELVNVYRRVGELELAAKTAMEWLDFAPSDIEAAHMACLLNRQKTRGDCYQPDQLQPAPFAIFDEFLTKDEREHFWQIAMKSKEASFEAGFMHEGAKIIDRQHRITDVIELDDADKHLFYGKIKPILDDLRFLLSKPAMPHKKIEVKMTAHSQGGFFGIHHDGFSESKGSTRYLSWLYYFHLQPKRYAGGDLVLFDSSRLRENHRFHEGKYTRYIPVDNQLVCFPSYFYHGVTPVELLQPGFECNRFAISGHVRY